MKRKCTIVTPSQLYNRAICIDVENAEEIMGILFGSAKYEDKYEYISGRILEQANMYSDDIYQRIYNKNGVKVSEMRFFPNGDNCRIYCREVVVDGNLFCIIMAAILPKKKPQKINKAIQQLIDSIKDYEYEIE